MQLPGVWTLAYCEWAGTWGLEQWEGMGGESAPVPATCSGEEVRDVSSVSETRLIPAEPRPLWVADLSGDVLWAGVALERIGQAGEGQSRSRARPARGLQKACRARQRGQGEGPDQCRGSKGSGCKPDPKWGPGPVRPVPLRDWL